MKIKDLKKWYHILHLIAWIFLIIAFVDMYLQNPDAGIVYDAGFIPNAITPIFVFIWLVFGLISLGAYIEAGIERNKLQYKGR